MQETCPMFLMSGSEILEVALVPMSSEDGHTWTFGPGDTLVKGVEGHLDTAIVETPVGCFMMPMSYRLSPGDTITLHATPGGPDWLPCRRGASQEIPVESVDWVNAPLSR